ncbi:MAG TPA: hypothetical protein VNZ22_02535, partial [Bacillota bacterium]|nr:hypothetical protein [Bacillota bacterium]
MSHYFPSLRGWVALILAFFSAMLLPALLPAHTFDGPTRHVPLQTRATIAVAVVACLTASVLAALHRRTPDRVVAAISLLLTGWLIIV